MIGLKRTHYTTSRLLGLGLGLSLGVGAVTPARAATPFGGAPGEAPEAVDQRGEAPFAEPPPEPARAAPGEDSAPLRIVEPEPEPEPEPAPIELVGPPAPAVTSSAYPGPVPSAPRVDTRRPKPGTGLMTLGAVSLAASSIMVVTAMAGPGWLDMERRDAAIVGGVALPVALVGSGLLVGGSKANERLEKWADRNQLSPPNTGNGMMVGGAVAAAGFGGLAAYGVQRVVTGQETGRGRWAPAVIAGSFSTIGLVVLAGGMLQRSRFAEWERTGYVLPGPMALKGGAGVSVSGRF